MFYNLFRQNIFFIFDFHDDDFFFNDFTNDKNFDKDECVDFLEKYGQSTAADWIKYLKYERWVYGFTCTSYEKHCFLCSKKVLINSIITHPLCVNTPI